MSDTTTEKTTDALLKRISELEANLAKANGDAKKYRLRLREEETAHGQLKTDHATLVTQHDELKASAATAPEEWKTKHDELQSKLHARDARDAWSAVIGDGLAPKATIEKLLSEIGYTPGEVPPTPEEIAEHLATARESVPYLLKSADATSAAAPGGATKTATRPPLKETAAVGRGVPGTTASRVTIRRSQLQDPVWVLDPANTKMIDDAKSKGVPIEVTDD